MTMHPCVVCGRTASVHILEGYTAGRPVIRRLCLACADSANQWTSEAAHERPHLTWPVLALLSGGAFLLIGLLGDVLVPERHADFGWHQQSGVVVAIIAVMLGFLLRVDLMALAGLFLLAASLGADWFGLVSGAGIGWKQQTVIALGAALVIGGASARRLRHRRRVGISGHGGGSRVPPVAASAPT